MTFSTGSRIALTLVGIGTGNPDHLTREAERALKQSDVILLPLKGEEKADQGR